MTARLNLEEDLDVFTTMVEHLTPYLYEDKLFGEISNRYPKLTLGGMLARQYRLRALEGDLSSGQLQRFHDARDQLEQLRYEWLSHYKEKLEQEFSSRLNAVRWFLDDCKNDPQTCDANYPNEAEKRTLIHHLVQEAQAKSAFGKEQRSLLQAIDQRLRGLARGETFLWDQQLKDIYPRSEFWWLYGRPGEHRPEDQ
jgi:hypothetical protein